MAQAAPSRTGSIAPSAKPSISYVCRLLCELGIACPTPEALRQAKFDAGGAPVAHTLWRSLHDVCVLALCGFPPERDNAALDRAWHSGGARDEPHAAALAFVVHTLACWGCPPRLARALSAGCDAAGQHVCTRALLLALAWAVAHTDACAHALKRRLTRAAGRLHSQLVPPFPFDVACTREACAAGEAAASAAEAVVAQAAHLRRESASSAESARLAAQHALLLQSRARGTTRQLTGLAACAAKQAYALMKSTASLSPYEIQLLRSPTSALASAHAAAAAALAAADEQAACLVHVNVFYAWVASALDEEDSAVLASGTPSNDEALDLSSGQMAYTQTQADALKRALDAELGRRQQDIALLAQQWQSFALADDAARAMLKAHAARVDASLPSYDAFMANAFARNPSSIEAADALDNLSEEVDVLLRRATEDQQIKSPGGDARKAQRPHFVLQKSSALTSSRKADAVSTGAPRDMKAAGVAVTDAAAELQRFRGFSEFTAEVLHLVTADNATALRAAVAPFAENDEYLVAGFNALK